MKKKAFRAALPYSLPICIGFLFIAMSYGFLMRSRGFSVFYPMAMSAFIFAGSMEFVAVELLLSAYAPLHAFLLTLMVNARHLFYGISMLEKYKGMGWKKPYLIFGMCDETFSINCTVTPAGGRGPRLVHVLRHPAQPDLLGRGRDARRAARLGPAL